MTIGKKQLTDRQRELLGYVQVRSNVAVFAKDEIIPDWPALKKVLVALGGKWRRGYGFEFPDDVDAAELVREAVESGSIIDPREADFFETPADFADELARSVYVTGAPDRILEPSAGKGALALAARRRWPKAEIVCIEALDQHVTALRGLGLETHQGDLQGFSSKHLGAFDLILMNPPFSKRQDILHVQKAFGFLTVPGAVIAIMSAGVAYRDDKLARGFRDMVADRDGVISPNPEGLFRASGTNVRTVTCRMWRRR